MRVQLDGALAIGATAKDLALEIVAALGSGGARGYAIEFAGPAVSRLTMDERMTICNMSIEAGATTAIIRPDDTTRRYLVDRAVDVAPLERWFAYAGPNEYDASISIDAGTVRPRVSWGTSPAESIVIGERVPEDAGAAALEYMGLGRKSMLNELEIDQVFIGSCTNSRLSDLRVAAAVLRGRRVCVPTIVTPGSQAVKRAAEREGLHDVFQDAGALWTHASCGPCLGMSMGVLAPGMRCVSTSNRNFPGRMGTGGRVHLASPVVAAASALIGHIPNESELRDLSPVTRCA
jgi:3-isopropylmalate/(R)-2-methylmalate dehydratase large subunit